MNATTRDVLVEQLAYKRKRLEQKIAVVLREANAASILRAEIVEIETDLARYPEAFFAAQRKAHDEEDSKDEAAR